MTDGWLNLLKPPGMTSHQVVDAARRVLGLRRVGHTGTLDPAAAGVLVLCVGRATRLSDLVGEQPKAYRAEITFGVTTDTLDAEGRVTQTSQAAIAREALEAALDRFRGEVRQRPPAYSAVQRGGRRSYELARRGEAVEHEKRVVRIDDITVVEFAARGAEPALPALSELEGNEVKGALAPASACAVLDVVCSKGTYIRSLAADIAAALGSCGYLSFLLRTRVGPFALSESSTLEEFQARGAELLQPMEVGVSHLEVQTLTDDEARRVANGMPVPTAAPAGARLRLHDPSGRLLAVAEASEGVARPRIVVHSED